MTTLEEAKQYLYRYGWHTDTTIDPIDLIRALVAELEQCQDELGYVVMVDEQDAANGDEDDEGPADPK
jgi:hypothetical protein